MASRAPAAAVLGALLLAGCADTAVDMAPAGPDQPWAPVTTADGTIVPGSPPAAGAHPGGYVLPTNQTLAADPGPAAIDSTAPLTLVQLIDIAESANPATRIAWNDARRVALAAGIAQAAFLPTLTATAIGGYQDNSNRNRVQDGAVGADLNGSGSATGSVSALSLQWLLFDFGKRAAVVRAARQASVIANIAFTAAHQTVIYDVSMAFYAYGAAQAHAAASARSVADDKTILAAALGRFRHGTGTVMEVATARQGVAQAELAAIQAAGSVQNHYLALLAAMGVSPLTRIQVATATDRTLSPALLPPLDAVIAQSLGRRPDVLAAYAALQASVATADAARAERAPKIFLTANGTYNQGSLAVTALPSAGSQQSDTVNVNGNRLGGSVFAGITVPLFDGGVRAAAEQQARNDADSAAARLLRTRQDAVRQIVVAHDSLRTAIAAGTASRTLQQAARTNFAAALAAYRHGVGSVTDLILADTQLLIADIACADAMAAGLGAAATLALSTGALGAAPTDQ